MVRHHVPSLLEDATKQYTAVKNKCGVLHSLAALAPLAQDGQLGCFVRALRLPESDDLADEEREVVGRVTPPPAPAQRHRYESIEQLPFVMHRNMLYFFTV